jgi:LysM repeat protein
VWRWLVVPLATVIATVGTVAAAAPNSESVQLTIEASTGALTSVLVPSEATLECQEDARGTGFLQRAAKPACALARTGAINRVAKQHRKARLCIAGYGGPQRASISGTVGGRRVNVTINRNDGCGIDEWNALRALLGDPERTGAIPRRPASAAPTTTTAPRATYLVQRGDTLTEIAKRFHTSIGAIISTNRLADADDLVEGQELTLPPPSEVQIDAKLVGATTDEGFDLTLDGAAPSELVTFVITLPDGSTHTGSQHVASETGVVTTTYTAYLTVGTYTVTATGERGTNAATSFIVDAPG